MVEKLLLRATKEGRSQTLLLTAATARARAKELRDDGWTVELLIGAEELDPTAPKAPEPVA